MPRRLQLDIRVELALKMDEPVGPNLGSPYCPKQGLARSLLHAQSQPTGYSVYGQVPAEQLTDQIESIGRRRTHRPYRAEQVLAELPETKPLCAGQTEFPPRPVDAAASAMAPCSSPMRNCSWSSG